MSKNYFADAEKTRIALTKAQKNNITVMYKNLAKDIDKEVATLSQRNNISSILRTQYLEGLKKQVNQELEHMATQQKTSIKEGMQAVSEAVIASNAKMIEGMGIHLSGTMSYIPRDVVAEISSGGLYKGRWNLNTAIWKNTKKTQNDINYIVAQGIAEQKPTYEIAKDLEKYVNPAKAKTWEWSKVYPHTAKVVDYNAQRLARTMISHAYEDSFVRATKDNPFVEAYEWLAGGAHTCDLCLERANGFHGVVINGVEMDGCYWKNELPLDHPNGMCSFATVTGNMSDVGDRLADWVNGKQDPELDKFARSLGYPISTVKESIH